MNFGEEKFLSIMSNKGINLISQPLVRFNGFKIRPDFYCPETQQYFEVISTKQAYFARKNKINHAIQEGIKISVVDPDGNVYPKLKTPKVQKIKFERKPFILKPICLNESDLRVLVYKKGFKSYAQLARKAGIYPQTLNGLLRGKRKTFKHREIIASLLGVPFDFLWD